MGLNLNHQNEINIFVRSIYDKKTYIYNYMKFLSIWLIYMLQFMICFSLTFLLIGNNIIVYISKKANNLLFYQWDKWMSYLDRKRIIQERFESKEEDKNYLIRYYIFLKGSSNQTIRKFPYNIFLHRFLKSDEPIMHDHPWSYTTLILCGGYWEHIPIEYEGKFIDTKFWRGPGYWSSYSNNHKHWIELPSDSIGPDATNPCWTLFIPGIKKGKWGFFPNLTHLDKEKQNDDWIESSQYLIKDEKQD